MLSMALVAASTRLCALTLLTVAVALTIAPPLAFPQPTPGSAAPFKAVGNEPNWTLDVGAGRLLLLTDDGKTRTALPLPPVTRIEGGRRYEARSDAHTLSVTILDRVCPDSMTGMPRPATVEVTLDGRLLKGCGGDSTALLRGGPWAVETVRDRPLVFLDAKKNKPPVQTTIVMTFDSAGRLGGTTSCNTYTSSYVLSGEGLTITMPIASSRPCQSQVMVQEAAFLETLRAVQRFEIAADGALVLVASEGGTITARRQQERVP
ncbi:putative membrane protein [Luteitalea pratensis]|uniref:Putative membrane protein n=1 Tax=Luteitalea pratensis TaxID=1855912 RepID=A0A143PHC9_LUTPR|nr:META domain-containing protein [Luteitalea pratensis]AMY07992.1 putative membrane protein [Luteitalea pratensis]